VKDNVFIVWKMKNARKEYSLSQDAINRLMASAARLRDSENPIGGTVVTSRGTFTSMDDDAWQVIRNMETTGGLFRAPIVPEEVRSEAAAGGGTFRLHL